jgi:hypothetical protein
MPPLLTVVRAWTCLGVNLLATPGLGSVCGGRKRAGYGQMFFAFTGFCLLVVYIFKMSFGIMEAQIEDSPSAPVPAWWWQSGVIFFGIGWLWSFFTSISLVRQAARTARETPCPAPPKLAITNKSVPPIL